MSAFILKLLDEAVLPAILVFCAKAGSLILFSRYLGVSFKIEESSIVFSSLTGFIASNDLSNLFVGIVILLGSGLVLLRLYFFHESHLTPPLLAKLLDSDLEFAVSTSFNLFHQVVVWLCLGFFTAASLLLQTLFGLGSAYIFFAVFLSLLGLTVLTILDFEREIKIERSDQPAFLLTESEL